MAIEVVIDGFKFSTETAEQLIDVSSGSSNVRDATNEDTYLYRTKKGRFFIAGSGGPGSRWRKTIDVNSWSGGSGLQLVDDAEAKRLVERHGNADDYARIFGEPEEG